MFTNTSGELLHHSFVINANENFLDSIISELGDIVINLYVEDSLSVDSVRNIISSSEMISRGGVNAYVIYFNEATMSAQNSLLKALEEPKKNTIFVLVTPNTTKLLDTIHSRCFYISTDNGSKESVDDFINLNMRDRLKFVEKIVKKHKDGKMSRIEIIDLMSGCIDVKKTDSDILRRLLDLQKLISLSSASVKQVLDSFAICLE